MTHEEMMEEAERRESANKINEHQVKTIAEMTREERVDAAIQEVWYIVHGGQDGREFANSILFIIRVLESLKRQDDVDKEFEHPWWKESTKNMSEKDRNRAYNMREIEYYNQRAMLDAVTADKPHTARSGKDLDLL